MSYCHELRNDLRNGVGSRVQRSRPTVARVRRPRVWIRRTLESRSAPTTHWAPATHLNYDC